MTKTYELYTSNPLAMDLKNALKVQSPSIQAEIFFRTRDARLKVKGLSEADYNALYNFIEGFLTARRRYLAPAS